jgi:hypothetical protein
MVNFHKTFREVLNEVIFDNLWLLMIRKERRREGIKRRTGSREQQVDVRGVIAGNMELFIAQNKRVSLL